jgi:type IV secretion system protein VirD4
MHVCRPDNCNALVFRGFSKMVEQSLLLGWPLTALVKSSRPFASARRSRRFSDLLHADHYRKDGHLITFAPTGAGKGVRAIIPNLLHYGGPVIVVDPKGENFAITARYRSTVLGQRIFLLDPFEAVSESLSENFLNRLSHL